MDKKIIDMIYKCYLKKTMPGRLAAICKLIKDNNGEEFFKKYSTSKDSIMEFLKKCEAQGLEL